MEMVPADEFTPDPTGSLFPFPALNHSLSLERNKQKINNLPPLLIKFFLLNIPKISHLANSFPIQKLDKSVIFLSEGLLALALALALALLNNFC